jgi:hypothetical protein
MSALNDLLNVLRRADDAETIRLGLNEKRHEVNGQRGMSGLPHVIGEKDFCGGFVKVMFLMGTFGLIFVAESEKHRQPRPDWILYASLGMLGLAAASVLLKGAVQIIGISKRRRMLQESLGRKLRPGEELSLNAWMAASDIVDNTTAEGNTSSTSRQDASYKNLSSREHRRNKVNRQHG